jgi:zinc transport system substrate-binding protein
MRCTALLLVALLAGCAAQPPATKLSVVVSFYPLYAFAKEVGGDRVDVRQLVPPGTSPHDYEPKPSEAAAVRNARVFVYNGAGLEPWVPRLEAELPADAVRVEATRGLPLVEWSSEHGHSEDHGHQERVDPHVWLDPVLAQQMVDNVTEGLAQADPQAAAGYRERAQALRGRLEALHTRYAQTLSRCRSRMLVTSHAAFGYLARRYGLRLESVAGLTHEAEPSPRRLRELLGLARREGVRAVYAETLAGTRAVETLARELGARLLVLDPLEGLSESALQQGKNYFSVMEENLRQLAEGLGCR